ncbi:TonB-dependent siderophore receptor [Marivirga sp.]|uniref:TonB-dependent siderophore receptor n=1 Tax=Marivirga sp. TaxID=2018662 RepID=UPI003DA79F8A
MKHILLLVMLASTSFVAFAQTGSLEGKVKDELGNPIQFVNVVVDGTSNGATTDVNGNYKIKNIQAGEKLIRASYIGYKTLKLPVEINENSTATLDFTLAEAIDALQTVEVIGRKEKSYKNDKTFSLTKMEMRSQDIPQSISYVTKELIQDQNAYRLNDVVTNVAGANQFSVYDDITLRGFRSSDNRYINGLRYTANFWTSPLLVNVERVEIIKGPSSALFGNASPGGIINMVTKKPLDEQQIGINFQVGSFNTIRTTADFTGPVNDDKTLLYRLNVGYEDGDSFRDLIYHKTFAVAPSISFVPNENTRLNFDLSVNDVKTRLDRGRPTLEGDQDLLSTPINTNISQPNDILAQNTITSTLSFSQKFSENISFNASYLRHAIDEENKEHRTSNQYIAPDTIKLRYNDRLVGFTNDNVTAYFNFNYDAFNMEHKTLVGYDYIGFGDYFYTEKAATESTVGVISVLNPAQYPRNTANYNFTSISTVSDYPEAYSIHAVYLQHLVKYGDLQFLASLRRESIIFPSSNWNVGGETDDNQTAYIPRFGLTYSITPAINLYGTYTQGYQPVAPATNLNPNAGGPFDPQYSNQIEFGAKAEFLNNRVATNLSVYQIEQNNILVNANDANNPELLTQRGQEVAKGVEIEAIGRVLPNFSISVNYAYNDAVITESDVESEIGLVKENAPKHMSGSWLKYTFDEGKVKGLGISLGHNFVSERRMFDRFTSGEPLFLPSYLVFNGAIHYSVDKYRIAFNLNNITNETYFSGGYGFARNFPGAPRNFMISVGYNF